MKVVHMRSLGVTIVGLALSWPVLAAETKNPVDIKEWNVPYENSRPRDPYAFSDEEIWFVGQKGHYVAGLNIKSGKFVKRDLDDESGPHNLIVGSDGVIWYAGNLKGYIGRIDPNSDQTAQISMPDEAARDPHTLVFDKSQEHIWFTVQQGNFIGRLSVGDHKVDLIKVPTPSARPYGIIIAPDGIPWIALFGTNKIASVDPHTLALTEYKIPDTDARPRRIDATSDGKLYYTDYTRGMLGRFDSTTKEFREWPMPSGFNAQPYAMAVDENDRVWIVETGPSPNMFVGFSPEGESFFSITPIPSGGGSIRHMHYYAPTHSIWFGTDANTVGRVKLFE